MHTSNIHLYEMSVPTWQIVGAAIAVILLLAGMAIFLGWLFRSR